MKSVVSALTDPDPALLDAPVVVERLQTDPERGLTAQEAARRLVAVGANDIESVPPVPSVEEARRAVPQPIDLPAVRRACRLGRGLGGRGSHRLAGRCGGDRCHPRPQRGPRLRAGSARRARGRCLGADDRGHGDGRPRRGGTQRSRERTGARRRAAAGRGRRRGRRCQAAVDRRAGGVGGRADRPQRTRSQRRPDPGRAGGARRHSSTWCSRAPRSPRVSGGRW